MSVLCDGGANGSRGSIMNETVIHIILISLVLVVFLFATAERVNGRDVRQQVLEKQFALLIDSAEEGMSFSVAKVNINGLIDSVEVRDGRIFVKVDGFISSRGYPYFSRYDVEVVEEEDKFVVKVG